MKKVLTLAAMALCSSVAFADEHEPKHKTIKHEKMEAFEECIEKAGVKMPDLAPGMTVKLKFDEDKEGKVKKCIKKNNAKMEKEEHEHKHKDKEEKHHWWWHDDEDDDHKHMKDDEDHEHKHMRKDD